MHGNDSQRILYVKQGSNFDNSGYSKSLSELFWQFVDMVFNATSRTMYFSVASKHKKLKSKHSS